MTSKAHEAKVCEVVRDFTLTRTKFRKSVISAIKLEDASWPLAQQVVDDEFAEFAPVEFNFVPDAYRIDASRRIIEVFEVEAWHRLIVSDGVKFRKLASAANFLDYYFWHLRVLVAQIESPTILEIDAVMAGLLVSVDQGLKFSEIEWGDLAKRWTNEEFIASRRETERSA